MQTNRKYRQPVESATCQRQVKLVPKQKPCSASGAEMPDVPMTVVRHRSATSSAGAARGEPGRARRADRRGPAPAAMTTTAPPRTFADLEPAGLELEVTCQRCGHVAIVDDTAPKLRHQRLAGRRYRCQSFQFRASSPGDDHSQLCCS